MELAMLGVGNGFSPGVYDNNAMIRHEGKMSLIDCGTTAWTSMDEMGISRKDVKEIFLTHLHFDHSGGVESAALYSQYIMGKKYRLIVPAPVKERLWDCVLKGTIENKEEHLASLEDYFLVDAPREGELFDFGGMKARWFPTRHVEGKFSCGLVLDQRFLYTSDMRCDLELVEQMYQKGVEVIFHDCQMEGAMVHGDFHKLCAYPRHLRERIYLMHHGLSPSSALPDAGGMHFLFQQQWMELLK